MQLKEKRDPNGLYDYSFCGDCEYKEKMCEPYQVVCGAWDKKRKAAQREKLRAIMNSLSSPNKEEACHTYQNTTQQKAEHMTNVGGKQVESWTPFVSVNPVVRSTLKILQLSIPQ